MAEIETVRQHPEGLTVEQEGLADLLFSTKIRASVKRRKHTSSGEFMFYDVERETSPFDIAQEEEFAFKLHEDNPAAPLSPDKIILRNLPENVLDEIGHALAELPIKEQPNLCTGLPNAGVALAKAYSKHSHVSFKEIFTKIQAEKGRKIVLSDKSIGGDINLLIIDDVLTKAFSFLEAVKALGDTRCKIVGFRTVVDREERGAEKLIGLGYDFSAVFKHLQLLNYYLRIGKLSQEQFNKIQEYIEISKRL